MPKEREHERCRTGKPMTCKERTKLTMVANSRSRILSATANTLSRLSPTRTTPSPHTPTANTTTVSATRAGPQTPRRCLSMSTVSSTCQSRRCRRTLWRRKVREPMDMDLRPTIEERLKLITWNNIVRKLSDALAQVRDEQSYIVVRERVHRNTAESTNGRVKWWSIFQLAVVIGEGIFQVWWLKRFFEVSFISGT